MGRLTQAEATDLMVESLQSDNRKLKAEAVRLGAEVVQLKHRLAERTEAHDRDGKALLRVSAEVAGLHERVAGLERLRADGVAIVEGLKAECERLRDRIGTLHAENYTLRTAAVERDAWGVEAVRAL